jgi:hypothetical protein
VWHDFDASNDEGTCLWCGRKLRKQQHVITRLGLGAYGDGFFCGLRCAYLFAVRLAQLNKRLTSSSRLPDPPSGRGEQ